MLQRGLRDVLEERQAFRARVLQVAGVLLTVLGPVFAFSEFTKQSAIHNAAVLSLVPVGLGVLAFVRAGRLQAGALTVAVGVIPVATWVHLFGERGQMAVMYLVPALVFGMIASEARTSRIVFGVVFTAGFVMRIARWVLQIDTDWGLWTTASFDTVAILGITGMLVTIALDRLGRDQQILEAALLDRGRHAESARLANDAKSEFLARVSHELRTPLNAILGYVELLDEEESVLPEGADDLKKVHLAASNLLDLVDDVLDLSRVEEGRQPIALDYVELDALMGRIQETVRPLVQRNGSTLRVDRVGADVACLDAALVTQVLLNLITNAARYTHDGEVSLIVEAGEQTVVFTVEDTGTGIEEARMATLFEPFARPSHEADGLGLTLCDRFVRLMGGHIEVWSELGVGSRFTVTLPMVAV